MHLNNHVNSSRRGKKQRKAETKMGEGYHRYVHNPSSNSSNPHMFENNISSVTKVRMFIHLKYSPEDV